MSNTTSLFLLHKRCQERTNLFKDLGWFVQTLLLRNGQQLLNGGKMLEWWLWFGWLSWLFGNGLSFVVILFLWITILRKVILFTCELPFTCELLFAMELLFAIKLPFTFELFFTVELSLAFELLSGSSLISLLSFHFSLKRLL